MLDSSAATLTTVRATQLSYYRHLHICRVVEKIKSKNEDQWKNTTNLTQPYWCVGRFRFDVIVTMEQVEHELEHLELRQVPASWQFGSDQCNYSHNSILSLSLKIQSICETSQDNTEVMYLPQKRYLARSFGLLRSIAAKK